MLDKLQESRTLEHDMAMAIVNKEFVVYYQPIVDSFSREIYSYEALIRWIHPLKGFCHRIALFRLLKKQA
jgi:EAL domain-containing protein (putative c-di-GMP-specific phosphodiesterase class I)